jgi:hypothetical protein
MASSGTGHATREIRGQANRKLRVLMRFSGLPVVIALMAGPIGCTMQPVAVTSGQSTAEVLEARAKFAYQGEPIPPFFLADLCGGPEADDFWTRGMGSRVVAVSLAGLRDQKRCYNDGTIQRGRFISFARRSENDDRLQLEFGYRFLGTTPSGISVVEYFGNTGGSGTIYGVVFVRFEMQTIGVTEDAKHDLLVMRFVGEQSWGDRVTRSVSLEGNVLRLGPTRADISASNAEPGRVIVLE